MAEQKVALVTGSAFCSKEHVMEDLANIHAPAALPYIERRTAALGFPMASEPRTGAMLRTLAATKPAGHLLELGTGTGLATAWLLDGMDSQSRLVSVDIDPNVQAVAREALGSDPRLHLITEDAAAFLRRTVAAFGVSDGDGGFDLIFADAMVGKYEMLDLALTLLPPGGFYVIDDMLPQASWPADHAPKVPQLMAELASRPELSVVNLAWSSGLVIAARRAEGGRARGA